MRTFVADINDVDEPLRGQYEKQDDGTFKLKIEGDLPEVLEMRTKVTEFRDNNVKLMKEKEDREKAYAKFEGIDPEQYKKDKARLEALEKKGAGSPDDLAQQIRAAVAAETEPLKQQVDTEKQARLKAEQDLKRTKIETDLRTVGGKIKIAPTAMEDFISRGKRVFDLEGVPHNGESILYSKKQPTEPMPMEEWGNGLLDDAPHLFLPSEGGGAGGKETHRGGKRVIDGTDPVELGRHMKDIAEGKVIVKMP